MNIKWAPLLDVVVVSLGSAVVVVFLVATALVGLSARSPVTGVAEDGAPRPALSATTGTALAVVCLAVTAAIVLYGLWVVVMR